MRKKTTKLTGLSKKLLRFLNEQKGFFGHGNKIRFTVHLGHRESALLFCLSNQVGDLLTETLETTLSPLTNSLEWDGGGKFWFDEETLLLNLASMNRFYLANEVKSLDCEVYSSGDYPFVILNTVLVDPDRAIPVQYDPETNILVIGQGHHRLLAHNYIHPYIRALLGKYPTKVVF